MTRIDAHTAFGSLFSTLASVAAPGFGRADAGPRPIARPAGPHGLSRALERLLTWSERARQRRQLTLLDDHMLRDIGMTRADVIAEAEKPFWRA